MQYNSRGNYYGCGGESYAIERIAKYCNSDGITEKNILHLMRSRRLDILNEA